MRGWGISAVGYLAVLALVAVQSINAQPPPDIVLLASLYNPNDNSNWVAGGGGITDSYTGKQWWLSQAFLYQVTVDFDGKSLNGSTFSLKSNNIEPFTVGFPLGQESLAYDYPSFVAFPSSDPTTLNRYSVSPFDGDWHVTASIELAVPPDTKWYGIASDQEATTLNRIFLYATNFVAEVAVNIEAQTMSLTTLINISTLYTNPTDHAMTRVTGVTIIPNYSNQLGYLFIGRAGEDLSKSGEIVLFNIKTQPTSFITVTFLNFAPINFFSWANPIGIGLYWTSINLQNTTKTTTIVPPNKIGSLAGTLTLYRYDFSLHSLTNASISTDDFGGSCYEWAQPVAFHINGNWALLTLQSCPSRRNTQPIQAVQAESFKIEEIFVDDFAEISFVTNITVAGYPPIGSLNIDDVQPGGAVFAGYDPKHHPILSMYKYGQ